MADSSFWDRIAARYAKKPIADEAAYEKKLEMTRHYLGPDASVLEIGCGTGSTAIAHAPRVASVLATDVSAKMLDIARDRAAAAGVANVRFEVAAAEDIDAADRSFDAVLALSLLHLLDDRSVVIEKVYDWLKPGGVFVSNTACLGDNMRWFRFIGPVGRWLASSPALNSKRVLSRPASASRRCGSPTAGWSLSWRESRGNDAPADLFLAQALQEARAHHE